MKVLHIAGFSNSGKTTLIRELVPALAAYGPVGVVKHLGHHEYEMPQGKDTTQFFEVGAQISIGVDGARSVAAVRETDLDSILEILCDAGMRYAVIEGFKERPFPKVVIGDYPGAERVILTNPSVTDILARLDEFSDFFTAGGIRREMQTGCDPGMTLLISTLRCPPIPDPAPLSALRTEFMEWTGRSGGITMRLEYRERAGVLEITMGICAHDGETAAEALVRATRIMTPVIAGKRG